MAKNLFIPTFSGARIAAPDISNATTLITQGLGVPGDIYKNIKEEEDRQRLLKKEEIADKRAELLFNQQQEDRQMGLDDRAANLEFNRRKYEKPGVVAGGITDALAQSKASLDKYALTEQEQMEIEQAGGDLDMLSPTTRSKYQAQMALGDELLKAAPKYTRMQQLQRIVKDIGHTTPEMSEAMGKAMAADLQAKKDLAERYNKQATAYSKDIEDYTLALAKENKDIGKSDSTYSKGSGSVTSLYTAAAKLGNADKVQEAIANAEKEGYSSKQIQNALAKVGGYDPETSFWDWTDAGKKDINVKDFITAIASSEPAGGKKSSSFAYRDALQKRIDNLKTSRNDALAKAQNVYADPDKVRMDKAAEEMKKYISGDKFLPESKTTSTKDTPPKINARQLYADKFEKKFDNTQGDILSRRQGLEPIKETKKEKPVYRTDKRFREGSLLDWLANIGNQGKGDTSKRDSRIRDINEQLKWTRSQATKNRLLRELARLQNQK